MLYTVVIIDYKSLYTYESVLIRPVYKFIDN